LDNIIAPIASWIIGVISAAGYGRVDGGGVGLHPVTV
jgi:hypothetical protein